MSTTNNKVKKSEPIANWILVMTTVLFGVIGVHDFVVGRTKQGFAHLLIFLISICLTIGLYWSFIGGLIPMIQLAAFLANWIWALCEIKTVSMINSGQYYMPSKKEKVISKNGKSASSLETISIVSIVISVLLLVPTVAIIMSAILSCKEGDACAAAWGLVALIWLGTLPYIALISLTIVNIVLRSELKNTKLITDRLKRLSNAAIILFTIFSLLLVAIFVFLSIPH